MMQDDIIDSIREELLQSADERTRESGQRFFKERVRLYGVKAAAVRAIAKRHYREIKPLGKSRILLLCEALLQSDYLEEAFIAFEWAYSLRREYEASDFQILERWVRDYVNNWAKCDTLCNHAICSFIEMYPEHIKSLKGWARSDNRWLRRASAVTLILPARRGMLLDDVFEISGMLLEDEDDLVQKGYGWMLKEASRCHQREVFDWVIARKNRMPRTALRYAIELLPEDLRRRAMER